MYNVMVLAGNEPHIWSTIHWSNVNLLAHPLLVVMVVLAMDMSTGVLVNTIVFSLHWVCVCVMLSCHVLASQSLDLYNLHPLFSLSSEALLTIV